MNILVTGASGFIGKNLVRRLTQDKTNRVTCLVRRTSNVDKLESLGVEFVFGDICEPTSLAAINIPVDLIFHCAAYVDERNIKKLNHTNIDGTENIFSFALDRKIKKIVYLSSVAVVSGNNEVPLTEDLPYAATNDYGRSKIAAEKIAIAYREKGLKVAIIRPSMVYGEEEPHMMRYLLKAVKLHLLPVINGGSAKLHMVYIQNVVDALIFIMNNDACYAGTFFIADKEVLTNREILMIIAAASGAKPPWEMPDFVFRALLCLPFIGTKLQFIQKDRVYGTQRMEALGFKFGFDARKALEASVQNFKF